MKHLTTLIDQVLVDAEAHDVEVSIQYDSSKKTLGASFKDEVDILRYFVADTDTLWTKIIEETAGGDITDVDCFWLIMNTDYKM